MKPICDLLRRVIRTLVFLLLLVEVRTVVAADRSSSSSAVVVFVIEGPPEGAQWMRRDVAGVWAPVTLHQKLYPGDWIKTGPRNRVLLKDSELETFWMDKRTQFRIPEQTSGRRVIELFRGVLYFFHRDKPDEREIRTRLVNSVVRGTEFNIRVDDDDTTTLTVFEGEVEMSNEFDRLRLLSGQAGRVEPGKAPVRTAVLQPINVIQWCLYYPAVLDLDELRLAVGEQEALRESLAAYRSGDVLAALKEYPVDRKPASDEERVYLAALLLSVGQVEQTEEQLRALGQDGSPRLRELADALRRLIAAVKQQPDPGLRFTPHASFLLAESYYQQAQSQRAESLETSLTLARQAVLRSTNFAFGEARVAELEFGFGRLDAAREAVDKSLRLAPRNAQALALKGFLAAARNDLSDAISYFDRAIAIDGALGNAWLGRGLCRIRRGQAELGRLDLQVAATVEPQRALLRSYLGKAFSNAGDNNRAAKELELAKRLDPNDPTAWLYSALLNQQRNRVNEAVRDLERSQELNDNRSVYRSRLLLDQDRAARGANLANVYFDADMPDVGLREAARAISADYANPSAHLFLANSYDRFRDPKQINLRYETAWLSEYLVANLLAPAAAGVFTPAIAQQEYSRLLERNRLGVVTRTEWLSRGDWLQTGAQFGILDNTSYALEANYRSENGQRANNDLELLTLTLRLKQQLTEQDSVFLQGSYYQAESGDVAPRYDPNTANLGLRAKETQEPLLLAGYHHEWSPGNHTLLLAGLLQDTLRVKNTNQQTFLVESFGNGPIEFVSPRFFSQRYRSELEIYSVELQQIHQQDRHTWVFGGRYQWGNFDTQNYLTNARPPIPQLGIPQHFRTDFERVAVYGYHSWQVAPSLLLVAGLSYDYLRLPENFRYAPIVGGEETKNQFSPKGGMVWTPSRHTTVRAAYARALGGVSFDQSFQLEPSQIAGFNQLWRSVIPEAVGGANAGARFDTFGASIEEKLPTGTYLGLAAEWLRSDVERSFGVVEFRPGFVPGQTKDQLEFDERSLTFSANQLLGREWTLGLRYRVSYAEFEREFPELPPRLPTGFVNSQRTSATLMQLDLTGGYYHSSGFFAQAESLWWSQDNRADASSLEDDEFWQFNAFVGYRFPRRRAEVRVGLLNLTDQDYRLNPLNLAAELPRSRTAVMSLRLQF